MTDPMLIGMVGLAGIAAGTTWTLWQLETAPSAAEEAAAYAERNGEEYPFDVGGEE